MERFRTTSGTRPGYPVCKNRSRQTFVALLVFFLLWLQVLIKIDWADKIAVAQVDTRGNSHDRHLVLICGRGYSFERCMFICQFCLESPVNAREARDTHQQSRQ